MAIEKLFAEYEKPNIVIIITDQQRALQHYPTDFIDKLPALKQLMNTGLSFERAFTAASACAPSRATFLTSQYPAKHKTKNTAQPQPKNPLNLGLDNLAKVLEKAGYETLAWLGKWHLGWAENVPPNLNGTGPVCAGFSEWNAPDAGTSISDYNTLGGGSTDNDGRYLNDMLKFVRQQGMRKDNKPFCLVASFVNPHDGFVAIRGLGGSGYASSVFTDTPVPLPGNFKPAQLQASMKPRAQASASWWTLDAQADQKQRPQHGPQDYVNFYAHLQTLVDGQIQQFLDCLAEQNLIKNTLIIRFADHGEMALSHGLVEKFFNAYEESIRIPLVFSNPIAWSEPQTTQALVSSVDLAPTLASLLGVSTLDDERLDAIPKPLSFDGKDLSPILSAENPAATLKGFDFVHFTYDDNSGNGPSIVRTIRTADWKYSVYFKEDGSDADWELYDLTNDQCENNNLAGNPDLKIVEKQAELEQMLQEAMSKLGTMPRCFDWPPQKTKASRGVAPNVHP